jgi:epoxide hydrolase-like protein
MNRPQRATTGMTRGKQLSIAGLVLLALAFGVLAARPLFTNQREARTTGAARSPDTTTDPRIKKGDNTVRSFRINVPQAALDDLRRRIAATRWPDKETVADRSQGTQLAKLQELVRYWGTDYDWRKVEAKLNALPQFITTIDGLDIHFLHVRSRHTNALPVIITHGWPGSIIEQMKIIDPLTNPTAHGVSASDAFDGRIGLHVPLVGCAEHQRSISFCLRRAEAAERSASLLSYPQQADSHRRAA